MLAGKIQSGLRIPCCHNRPGENIVIPKAEREHHLPEEPQFTRLLQGASGLSPGASQIQLCSDPPPPSPLTPAGWDMQAPRCAGGNRMRAQETLVNYVSFSRTDSIPESIPK